MGTRAGCPRTVGSLGGSGGGQEQVGAGLRFRDHGVVPGLKFLVAPFIAVRNIWLALP